MYSDMNELKNNILQRNEIGELLVSKMFLTDEEIAEEVAKGSIELHHEGER